MEYFRIILFYSVLFSVSENNLTVYLYTNSVKFVFINIFYIYYISFYMKGWVVFAKMMLPPAEKMLRIQGLLCNHLKRVVGKKREAKNVDIELFHATP